MSTGRRRVAAGLLSAIGLVALLALAQPDMPRRAWQRAYPHLPARIQALPYRLQARLGGPEATPLPVPTADVAALPVEPTAGAPTATWEIYLLRPTPSPAPADAVALPPTAPPLPTTPALVAALPDRVVLPPIRHEYQTWNNCGPATVSMALSAFGDLAGQREAAQRLKPDPDDRNVSPDELARYARERGYAADVIVGGDIALLQRLMAAGAAVIVEFWFIPDPNDEMGHYRLLTAYDVAARTFGAADSYNGPAVSVPWDAFDADWRAFNRTLVAVYPAGAAPAVAAALGPRGDREAMWVQAASTAQAEVDAIGDAFAWFNLGSSLSAMGQHAEAVAAFDRARSLGLPWRMLWYQFAPYEAYAAVGRWDDVAALAENTLTNVGNLEESLYWRGRARQARGDLDGARADWERARLLNPLWEAPAAALGELAP